MEFYKELGNELDVECVQILDYGVDVLNVCESDFLRGHISLCGVLCIVCLC